MSARRWRQGARSHRLFLRQDITKGGCRGVSRDNFDERRVEVSLDARRNKHFFELLERALIIIEPLELGVIFEQRVKWGYEVCIASNKLPLIPSGTKQYLELLETRRFCQIPYILEIHF